MPNVLHIQCLLQRIPVNTTYYVTASLASGTTFAVAAYPGGSAISWTTVATTSFTVVFGYNGRETINDQNLIRTSQQAAVAFPK